METRQTFLENIISTVKDHKDNARSAVPIILRTIRENKNVEENPFYFFILNTIIHGKKEDEILLQLHETLDKIKKGEELPLRPVKVMVKDNVKDRLVPVNSQEITKPPVDLKGYCIIYTQFVDPEYFKNSVKVIKKYFNIPVFVLKGAINASKDLPTFDFDNMPYSKAILWQDNFFPITNVVSEYYPIIKDESCVGPLTVDLLKFKDKLDAILAYEDIKYGYLKETDSLKDNGSNVYVMDKKVCCREKSNYYKKDAVVVCEGGKPYLALLPSLYLKITKGE